MNANGGSGSARSGSRERVPATIAEAISAHAGCAGELEVALAADRDDILVLDCPGCGARLAYRAATTSPPTAAENGSRPRQERAVPGSERVAAGARAPIAIPPHWPGQGPGERGAGTAPALSGPIGVPGGALARWTRGEDPDARTSDRLRRAERKGLGRPLLRTLAPFLVLLVSLLAIVVGLLLLVDDGSTPGSDAAAPPAGGTEAEAGEGPEGGSGGRADRAGGARAQRAPRREDAGGSMPPVPNGTRLGYVEVEDAVRIGLPPDWGRRADTPDGALVFAPPEGSVAVRVWFETDSDLGARAIAREAGRLIASRRPGAAIADPTLERPGSASISGRYEGGTETARGIVDGGVRLLGLATVPDTAPTARRAEAEDVLASLEAP